LVVVPAAVTGFVVALLDHRDLLREVEPPRLNFVFNLIYAQAMLGFWLPCDDPDPTNDDNVASELYEEWRGYLWPSLFLFVISFVSGVWQITMSLNTEKGKVSPAYTPLNVKDFVMLTYLGLSFALSPVLVFTRIEV